MLLLLLLLLLLKLLLLLLMLFGSFAPRRLDVVVLLRRRIDELVIFVLGFPSGEVFRRREERRLSEGGGHHEVGGTPSGDGGRREGSLMSEAVSWRVETSFADWIFRERYGRRPKREEDGAFRARESDRRREPRREHVGWDGDWGGGRRSRGGEGSEIAC